MQNFCDGRHKPLQSIKAYLPYSTSIVRNSEGKRSLGKARNRKEDKIKEIGPRMWTRHM
jgi:hypothetical protein